MQAARSKKRERTLPVSSQPESYRVGNLRITMICIHCVHPIYAGPERRFYHQHTFTNTCDPHSGTGPKAHPTVEITC